MPYFADLRIGRRSYVVRTDFIDHATDRLADLIDRGGPDGLLLADLFLRASKAHQDHNHSMAFIDYWAVIERLLQEAWDQYKEDNAGREDGAFMRGARPDGLNYTAAVVIEIMSFADRIPFELYEQLSQARKARNRWIHKMKRPSAEDVVQAMQACESLLQLVQGVTLNGTVPQQIHT